MQGGFPGGSVVKNSPADTGDKSSIPGSGRSPGGGNGNPLQYPSLEDPMDRGPWRAAVLGATEHQVWLSACTHRVIQITQLVLDGVCKSLDFEEVVHRARVDDSVSINCS